MNAARSTLRHLAILVLAMPAVVSAQDAPPPNLANLEHRRSRACVAGFAALEELDRRLEAPRARLQRLSRVADAVALERLSFADSLDSSDALEREVALWFGVDQELANRFVEEGDSARIEQRRAARADVENHISRAAEAVQVDVAQRLEQSQDLLEAGAPCEGAILVRGAVVDACRSQVSPVCALAEATGPTGRVQFVDAAADLWDVEEIRPWSDPEPIGVGPNGQLTGGRTSARTRRGNLIFTVRLVPLIRPRTELVAEEVQLFEAVLDSLGFQFDHPELVFAPALEINTNVTEPLGDETFYVVHFGDGTDPDVLYSTPARSGEPVGENVLLTPRQLERLKAGDIITLSAVSGPDGETAVSVFAMEITNVGQSPATSSLVEYLAGAFAEDLARLAPPP